MKWLFSLLSRNRQAKQGRPATKKRKFRKRPLPLHLETLEARLAPAVVTWGAGGDGTSWSDPHNWTGNVVPGSGDDVVINATPASTVLFAAGTATIHSLFFFKQKTAYEMPK